MRAPLLLSGSLILWLLCSLGGLALAKAPANDLPANRQLLVLDHSAIGTTREATATGSPAMQPTTGCDRRALPDVWYTYSPPWGRYTTKLSFLLRIRCTTTQLVRVGRITHSGMRGSNPKFPFSPDTCVQVTPAQGTVEIKLAPYYDELGVGRTYDVSVSSLPKDGGDFTIELAYDAARMPCTLPTFEVAVSYSTHKAHNRGRTAHYERFERVVMHLAELPADAPAYLITLGSDYGSPTTTRESRGGKEVFSTVPAISMLRITVTRRSATGGSVACTQSFGAQQAYFPDR